LGKKILILGAGFGGLEAASGLSENLGHSHDITLIDKSDYFIIGFSKFEVMFGRRAAAQVKSYYADLSAEGVNFVQDTIEQIDLSRKIVTTTKASFGYDFLILGLGAELAPELMPGFVEGGYEFYSLDGAEKLFPILDRFTSGTILLSIFGKPYKCPPAPYEAAFQLDDFFTEKGLRENIDIKMLIPAPVPLPVAPGAGEEIQRRFDQQNITLLRKHKVVAIDPAAKQAQIEGRDALGYDLFIGVPHHRPPEVIRKSALGNNGWIQVDTESLMTAYEGVYAVGDVTKIPVGEGMSLPKAGAFAEDAARVVVNQITRKITGEGRPVKFDGAGACYLEFGAGQVARIKANFLGQSEPDVFLEGPSAALRQGKNHFADDRIQRWFR
jgi:sulfide:quinone oxidoreductase